MNANNTSGSYLYEHVTLYSAVGDLGQAWQKVKERVGRSANDCRDRWRNHLANRLERQRGNVLVNACPARSRLTPAIKELGQKRRRKN